MPQRQSHPAPDPFNTFRIHCSSRTLPADIPESNVPSQLPLPVSSWTAFPRPFGLSGWVKTADTSYFELMSASKVPTAKSCRSIKYYVFLSCLSLLPGFFCLRLFLVLTPLPRLGYIEQITFPTGHIHITVEMIAPGRSYVPSTPFPPAAFFSPFSSVARTLT